MAEPPADYVLLWDEQFLYADGPLNYDANYPVEGVGARAATNAGGWALASTWNGVIDGHVLRNGTAAEMNVVGQAAGASGFTAKQLINIPRGALNSDWNLRFLLRLAPGTAPNDDPTLFFGFGRTADVADQPSGVLEVRGDGTATATLINSESDPFPWDASAAHDFIWRKRGIRHSLLIDGTQRAYYDFATQMDYPFLGMETDDVIGGDFPVTNSQASVKIERIQFHWLPRYEGGAI